MSRTDSITPNYDRLLCRNIAFHCGCGGTCACHQPLKTLCKACQDRPPIKCTPEDILRHAEETRQMLTPPQNL